jgi:exosortase K
VKTKILLLAGAASIAWGLKRHYADAHVEDLWWILTPTARLAGLLTGTAFEMQAGEGYFARERLFMIEKSCAGVNFLVAAFGMLTLARHHRAAKLSEALRVLVTSLVLGYATAVVINAVRIAVAMWLASHPLPASVLSAAAAHRLEGIIVYFGGLLLLHGLLHQFDHRPPIIPLAAYYVVTLAVPIANGSAAGAGFMKHALIVLIVPVVMIGMLYALRRPHDRARLARCHDTRTR